MKQFVKKVKKIKSIHITDRHDMVNIYETREMTTMATRDMKMVSAVQHEGNFGIGTATRDIETAVGDCNIKVVVSQINNSKKHFFSVMGDNIVNDKKLKKASKQGLL